MGRGPAAAAIRGFVRVSEVLTFPVFPLAGALLLPRAHLPLHIFEPRYRAMVQFALAHGKRIGMVQPRPNLSGGSGDGLFEVGCLGEIVGLEELEDGRFNVVLHGLSRYRIRREIEAETPFRQVEAELDASDGAEPEALASVLRADLEREARRFADALGLAVDWNMVSRLDDDTLVSAIAQVAPFDAGSKQALLEAEDMATRADMLVQFMAFQRMAPGGADGPQTLQ